MNPSLSPDIALLPEHPALWQSTLHWQPTPEQQALLQCLYAGIVAGNQRLNLTRIVEPEDFWEKHLWDSLRGIVSPTIAPRDDQPLRVIDIGTGAGFPGLVIAIARPHWHITLLDGTRKKIAFLQELIQELGFENVQAIADRAEQWVRQPGSPPRYDLACLRAVGSSVDCARYALPLLATGGIAVLYRGHWTPEEEAAIAPVLTDLGGEIVAIEPCTTPLTAGVRHCVYLKRV